METFEKSSMFPVSAQELFAWHERPGAFERLMPPWENLEIVQKQGSITDGSKLVFDLRKGPFRVRWEAAHDGYLQYRRFRDVQTRGPFRFWEHTHHFEPMAQDFGRSEQSSMILHQGQAASKLTDHIEYQLPLHSISRWFAGPTTRRKLEQMFAFRHQRTRMDIEQHHQWADKPRQTVAITGSSGLVGEQLKAFLTTGGHSVRPVRRKRRQADDSSIYWKPSDSEIEAPAFEGLDAVFHLAGENIAEGLWTESKRKRIMDSRQQGTNLLSRTLAQCERKPKVLISASAIGFYGDRGDEILTEDSASGNLFLSEVCEAWEEATQPARDAGIRTVNLRIGVVLSAQGGVLGKLLTPFQFGLGGKLGQGSQWMSWISLDDLIGAMYFALFDERVQGPVNAVAPHAVTNAEFTRQLGQVLSRPTWMTVPAFAAKLAMGQMADELLFASQRVLPSRLQQWGFEWNLPTLDEALRFELGEKS